MRALMGLVLAAAVIHGVLPEGRAREAAGMILGLILISRIAQEIANAARFW